MQDKRTQEIKLIRKIEDVVFCVSVSQKLLMNLVVLFTNPRSYQMSGDGYLNVNSENTSLV